MTLAVISSTADRSTQKTRKYALLVRLLTKRLPGNIHRETHEKKGLWKGAVNIV